MALIAGFITTGASGQIVNLSLTLGLRAFAFDEWPPYEIEMAAGLRSTVASQLPVSTVPRAIPAHVATSFFDDFYNRVHIRPASLDLGNLVSGATRTVDVWNAFLAPQLMSSIDLPDDPGIEVIQPVAVPYTMPPIALLEYELTFTAGSSPTIDDELGWTIGGIPYTLPIIGRRVVAWPFLATWDRGVDEHLEWFTSVDRAYDGTEQRISLRAVPRRFLEFTVREKDEAAQRLDNMLYGWHGRFVATPIFPERSSLTAPALAGSTTLQLPTARRTFVAGGLAVLRANSDVFEVVEVSGVTPTSVTLSRPTTLPWDANTPVYPAMVSRLEGTTAVLHHTDTLVEAPVRMAGIPGDVDPRIPAVAAPATYAGHELYLGRTNWLGGVPFEFETDTNIFDGGTGRINVTRRSEAPIVGKRHRWTLKTPAEQEEFRAWLGRRKGRAVPVWMPTGTSDFTLLTPVTAVGSQAIMATNAFDQFGAGLDKRTHILVRLRGGAYIARQIVSASVLPDNTLSVLVDAAFGIAFAPADVREISFLQLWRLASDSVTIQHATDSVSVAEAVLRLA